MFDSVDYWEHERLVKAAREEGIRQGREEARLRIIYLLTQASPVNGSPLLEAARYLADNPHVGR